MKKTEQVLTEHVTSHIVCPSPYYLISVQRAQEKDADCKIEFTFHGYKHAHMDVDSVSQCIAFLLVQIVEKTLHSMTRQRVYELMCERFGFEPKDRRGEEKYWKGPYEPAYEDEEDTGYKAFLFDLLTEVAKRKRLFRCSGKEDLLRKADLFCDVMRDERRFARKEHAQRMVAIEKDIAEFHRAIKVEKRKTALKQLRIRKLHKPRSRR